MLCYGTRPDVPVFNFESVLKIFGVLQRNFLPTTTCTLNHQLPITRYEAQMCEEIKQVFCQ